MQIQYANQNVICIQKANEMHCLSQVVYTKNTVGAQEARRFSCSAHTQNVHILFNGISKAESLIF